MIEANELLEDLRELGVESGDLLCIHSSYKSIGTVNGGADTVIRTFPALEKVPAGFEMKGEEPGHCCFPPLHFTF